MIRILLFTHPICSGCQEALAAAERLRAERPDEVELEVISLASARGRQRAREASVVVVPTLIVGEQRIVGAPTIDELRRLVDEARAARIGGAR